MSQYDIPSGSSAESLFLELFSETFGIEKAGLLYSQYHFYDIYHNSRFADFLVESYGKRIAIEIDDEASHNPRLVSFDKYTDDLLKQNSMIHLGWDVYRWTVRQMQRTPDTVKDELNVFLGNNPQFSAIDDYLPTQKGDLLDGSELENRDYQNEALDNLSKMREDKKTIGLLFHAVGTGKTVTSILDAKSFGGRTLFVAPGKKTANQAMNTFRRLWKDKTVGQFFEGVKETDCYNVCAVIDSLALNLELFHEDDFDYIIIDEAHHAAAESYQKVLKFFRPKFTLGLTGTPDRADGKNALEMFQNTAHKLDIQQAVEIGALVSVRCIRIHTNIDMTKVRYNSVQYNIRDLNVSICVTERNKLIVDTYLQYVRDKLTVVFCTSVSHAETMSKLFNDAGINASAVSGKMKSSEVNEITARFTKRELSVLCACDLLNEGWDCPQVEVLFMARPTMSKTLYIQQLGRGMRLSENKEFLMVFDFVDNANQYNMPQSLHRVFRLSDYHPGETVLGHRGEREAEDDLYRKGEKPLAVIDYPVNAMDYEAVDVFNWQNEAEGMLSQMEFVRMVDIQSETIEKYIMNGKIIPDLIIPLSSGKKLNYFKEETIKEYANQYSWRIIEDSNKKDLFMEMIEQMDMSYSYKPVFIKAVLEYADEKGRVSLSDIVSFFRAFYDGRRKSGRTIEKKNSLFVREEYTDKEAEYNILSNPFKRFEDMNLIHHTKTLGFIEVDKFVWKKLTDDDKKRINEICDLKIEQYYLRIG